jgi:hypothetical protein
MSEITAQNDSPVINNMHQVESLTRLYRARYYWHTPELDRTVAETLNLFGDLDSFDKEFINQFLASLNRQPVPDCQSSRIFYEPCVVVKTAAMEIIVVSQTMPYEITKLYPDFNKGGKFHINKAKLQRDGKAHHSRHGEYFYIAVPDSAAAQIDDCKEKVEVEL